MTKLDVIALDAMVLVITSGVGNYFDIGELEEQTFTEDMPTGILGAFDFIGDTISWFWNCITFQLDGSPLLLNWVMLILTLLMFSVLLLILRGN